MHYLNKQNILFDNQYGLRKNHSTLCALTNLLDKIATPFNKKFTLGIFLDLTKAFDTVDHEILFLELEHYGILGLALEWVKNYFSNRHQYVEYNALHSCSKNIKCGVAQRSIRGPLLFLIYMNDRCNASIISEFIFFADDTNVFILIVNYQL